MGTFRRVPLAYFVVTGIGMTTLAVSSLEIVSFKLTHAYIVMYRHLHNLYDNEEHLMYVCTVCVKRL